MGTTDRQADRLSWVKDDDPRWDPDRERVFADAGADVFPGVPRNAGERLPSDWWRVEDGGRVVGYGWLDDVWGDAEILLAVEEAARGTGAGSFALARLEDEAATRGLNYVVNVVRDTHPDRSAVTGWFLAHGFTGTDDGRLRKQVGTRDTAQQESGRPSGARQARYAAERARAAALPRREGAVPSGPDLGPGHEESGGYVDPGRHRY